MGGSKEAELNVYLCECLGRWNTGGKNCGELDRCVVMIEPEAFNDWIG